VAGLMKNKTYLFHLLFAFVLSVAIRGQGDSSGQSEGRRPEYQIAERGQDFAVYRKVSSATNAQYEVTLSTNQFTLLENGLHYQDAATGEWKESEDVIESFAEGAVARRGPHKAIFAHELNSQVVFDIQAADGKRIRGGVRAIQLTDTRTQETITLATVRDSVTAQILPPNSILFADGFTGLKADVLINWKHSAWSHDVVLREQPELPPGWNVETTRLEVLTEFIVDAEPDLRRGQASADPSETANHPVIDFGAMAMIVGKAFAVAETNAVNFGGDLRQEGAPVRKHWQRTADGRHFLIESLDWNTASKSMTDIPVRRHASNNPRPSYVVPPLGGPAPTQVAASHPRGYAFDFLTISGSSPTTLTNGATYYIKTSYGGSSITIQSDARVKFKNNAYMIFYGGSSFPGSGGTNTKAIFTSRNDDSVGDRIAGVTGEDDSDGDPSSHRANPALWLYYDTSEANIRNSRIRWAKVGIQIDDDDDSGARSISDCFFENITSSGSAGVAGSPRFDLTLTNLSYCKVTTPGVTMTPNCIGIENAWPGDSSWELSKPVTAGWPTNSTQTTPEIEGFAGLTSVNCGSSINLYVDVRTNDANYKIEVFRMGWYNGVGGRKMGWYDANLGASVTAVTNSSFKQPVPEIDLSTNGLGVVDCLATNANGHTVTNWSLSYTLAVPSWWLSGVYLAKLTTLTNGFDSYIIFTVREDGRASDLLVQSSVATWEAYNPWGGNSLYPYPMADGAGNCGAQCLDCFGQKVSFNRPYAQPTCSGNESYGAGAGEFLAANPEPGWEYNALRWFEKQGYDATYCTSVDTHSGALTNKSVKAFVSVGHDEYWSYEARAKVEAGRDRTNSPINLIFLGSNICYWRVHYGADLRSFSCVKGPNVTDMWRWTTQTNPEVSLVGVEYVYNSLYGGDLTVTNVSGHWAFNHTGITTNGSQTLPGLLGYEVDGHWLGTRCNGITTDPPNWGSGGQYDTIKLGDSAFTVGTCTGGHSYVTIYTATNGPSSGPHAQVFATGSMEWNYGLDDYGYYSKGFYSPSRVNSAARQITHNVIRTFTGNSTSVLP